MRAIVQRVNHASVYVGGEMISSIGRGLLVLLGLCREDQGDTEGMDYMVRKLLNTRLFDGAPPPCCTASSSGSSSREIANEGIEMEGGGGGGDEANSGEGGAERRWDKSVKDLNLEILCVSQFTLHSKFKGNRLDFHRAMSPREASANYTAFLDKLRGAYGDADKVKNGRFGARSRVELENDGPVTLIIDSKNRD